VLAADAGGVAVDKGTISIGGKAAAGAVVSIEGLTTRQAEAQTPPAATKKKVMDQRDQKFSPTVVAIMAGGTVEFPNNDKIWHNVYSKGGANDFDLGVYPPGETRSKTFDKAGVSRVLCNAHPSMEAFIVVKDHPFFSTADGQGNYEIRNVPVGKARVDVWYPNVEARSETVEIVSDGEVLALNVDLEK
jgi:plastocyanin